MLGRQTSMLLHLNKAGRKMEVVMEISHVTVTASEINPCNRLPGALEMHVLGPVHLRLGIDVVMPLRLVVAIVQCMVNTVEMHVTMSAVATVARIEVEGTLIASEVPIVSVGAQVLVAQAMTCLRRVLSSSTLIQTCAKE